MEERKTSGFFRCLVYNGGVSLTLIQGGQMCENGVKMQGFHGEKARYFCGALLCTAFLGGLLKENGEVSAVIKTDGTLQNITASASAALNVRACMDCRKEGENGGEESGKAAKNFCGSGGSLQVVKSDSYSLRPFVGACALKCGKNQSAEEFFEENFEEYFTVSEQIPTRFKLAIGDKIGDKTCKNGEESGGEYLCAALQSLPGAASSWQATAKEKLSAFIKEYEKTKEAKLAAQKIFGGISCEENRALQYKCNCSKEYLKGVLSSLGKNELESILEEQGAVKIHCRYCNKDYAFTREDLKDVLSV